MMSDNIPARIFCQEKDEKGSDFGKPTSHRLTISRAFELRARQRLTFTMTVPARLRSEELTTVEVRAY
jgi:hypothetical protein